MKVTIEREKSKYEKAIEEPYRRAQEEERVRLRTYKCPYCKDAGGHQVFDENGNESWKKCEYCQKENEERTDEWT